MYIIRYIRCWYVVCYKITIKCWNWWHTYGNTFNWTSRWTTSLHTKKPTDIFLILCRRSLLAWPFQHSLDVVLDTCLSAGLFDFGTSEKAAIVLRSCQFGWVRLWAQIDSDHCACKPWRQGDLHLGGLLQIPSGLKGWCRSWRSEIRDRLTCRCLQEMRRNWWTRQFKESNQCRWMVQLAVNLQRAKVGRLRSNQLEEVSGLARLRAGKKLEETHRNRWGWKLKVRCPRTLGMDHHRMMGSSVLWSKRWWKSCIRRTSDWNLRWSSWEGARFRWEVEKQRLLGQKSRKTGFPHLRRDRGVLHVAVFEPKKRNSLHREQGFQIQHHQKKEKFPCQLFHHGHGVRMGMKEVMSMDPAWGHGALVWGVVFATSPEAKDIEKYTMESCGAAAWREVKSKAVSTFVMENQMKWWMLQQPEQNGWGRSWWRFNYKWREKQSNPVVSWCRITGSSRYHDRNNSLEELVVGEFVIQRPWAGPVLGEIVDKRPRAGPLLQSGLHGFCGASWWSTRRSGLASLGIRRRSG